MADIFLSYNREDQATAQRFAQAFEAEGFSVWWDATLRSGDAYDTVTEAALKSARVVVVLWSRRSVESRWVRAEATVADRNRTLVPARIEDCDLPVMFELTQTADLCHWRGEASDAAWSAFLADVRRFVETETLPSPAPPSRPAPAAPTGDSRPSIAVLPFVNRSGLAEDDVFADGMVEDLTAALSINRRMKVIASSATQVYRSGARDLQQIGRGLGVRYLLEGNVRRVDADLRVTAQLVEAEDGDILWSQKFDRPLAELSSLQEDLVTEVAACLGVEVQRAEMELALRKPGDITAWEAVMRADAHLTRLTRSGLVAAVAEARRATTIDPGYDLALATLAMALGALFMFSGKADPTLEQEIVDTLARVRSVGPNDPIALARIAMALYALGRYQDALPFAERAVAINPNLDVPHISMGSILLMLGRRDEAVAEAKAAIRLAPNGIWIHAPLTWLAIADFQAGKIESSLALAEQSLRLRPNPPAFMQRVICLAKLGRVNEARRALAAFRETNPETTLPALESQFLDGLYRTMEPEQLGELRSTLDKLWRELDGEAGSP